jgi:hypothetical protein
VLLLGIDGGREACVRANVERKLPAEAGEARRSRSASRACWASSLVTTHPMSSPAMCRHSRRPTLGWQMVQRVRRTVLVETYFIRSWRPQRCRRSKAIAPRLQRNLMLRVAAKRDSECSRLATPHDYSASSSITVGDPRMPRTVFTISSGYFRRNSERSSSAVAEFCRRLIML